MSEIDRGRLAYHVIVKRDNIDSRLPKRSKNGLHFLGGPEPVLTRRGVLNISRDGFFRIDRAREQLGYEPRLRAADGLPAILPDVKSLYDRLVATRGRTAQ